MENGYILLIDCLWRKVGTLNDRNDLHKKIDRLKPELEKVYLQGISIFDGQDPYLNKTAHIIQHPQKSVKQLAYGSLTKVDDFIFHYQIPTLKGSSGSMVLDENENLIGLHRQECREHPNCNIGIRITALANYILMHGYKETIDNYFLPKTSNMTLPLEKNTINSKKQNLPGIRIVNTKEEEMARIVNATTSETGAINIDSTILTGASQSFNFAGKDGMVTGKGNTMSGNSIQLNSANDPKSAEMAFSLLQTAFSTSLPKGGEQKSWGSINHRQSIRCRWSQSKIC